MSRRDKLNEVFGRALSSSTQSINQTDVTNTFPADTLIHQNIINSCVVNFLSKLEQDVQVIKKETVL